MSKCNVIPYLKLPMSHLKLNRSLLKSIFMMALPNEAITKFQLNQVLFQQLKLLLQSSNPMATCFRHLGDVVQANQHLRPEEISTLLKANNPNRDKNSSVQLFNKLFEFLMVLDGNSKRKLGFQRSKI